MFMVSTSVSMIMIEPLQVICSSDEWMQYSAKWLPTLTPSQMTWATSPTATVYTHHHDLLLLLLLFSNCSSPINIANQLSTT